MKRFVTGAAVATGLVALRLGLVRRRYFASLTEGVAITLDGVPFVGRPYHTIEIRGFRSDGKGRDVRMGQVRQLPWGEASIQRHRNRSFLHLVTGLKRLNPGKPYNAHVFDVIIGDFRAGSALRLDIPMKEQA